MRRRDVLKLMAAGAAGVLATPLRAEAAPNRPRRIEPRNPAAPPRLPTGLRRRVLVVGGGLAGLSAALELAERGYDVVVREAAQELGGKLATRRLATGAGSFAVEHGLHMWFHNYHVFRDLRARLGIDGYFRPYGGVHFVYRNYQPEVLLSDPPVYPLNLLALLRRSPNLGLLNGVEQLGLLRSVLFYNHAENERRLDRYTFTEWMRGALLTPTFQDVLLKPAAAVTLNDPDRISAAEMTMLMHLCFTGHPLAMNREVTTVDHGTAVIEPWAARLRSLGVRLETGRPVLGLEVAGGRAVGERGDPRRYDAVVLASAVGGARAVLSGSTAADPGSQAALDAVRRRLDALEVAPPYQVLRVWLDQRPRPDRPDIIETPEHRPINLLAQFNLLEEESRRWADAVGGSVLELHLYAQTPAEAAERDPDRVWQRVRPVLSQVLPELAGARALGATLGSYHDFTSFAVGQATLRPDSNSPAAEGLGGLTLAGDWVRTAYPSALMERAVATGREAANHILLGDGVRQAALTVTSSHGPGLW